MDVLTQGSHDPRHVISFIWSGQNGLAEVAYKYTQRKRLSVANALNTLDVLIIGVDGGNNVAVGAGNPVSIGGSLTLTGAAIMLSTGAS